MLVTRFDPFRNLRRMQKDLHSDSNIEYEMFAPTVNTREGEYAFHIDVDLPGINKDDIKIDVEDDMLTVSGERKLKEETKEEEFFKVESFYGKFSRSFQLPENCDTENIKASTENGVLEIMIPKLEIREQKRVIKVA